MTIYLVEDDPIKAGMLVDFLANNFQSETTNTYQSFQSGLRAIVKNCPDLILLDMTIPTFDRGIGKREGRLRPLGGYDLMRKLSLRKIPFKAIVVTQLEAFGEGEDKVTFKEITAKCEDEFSGRFLGGIHFQQGSDSWKANLNSMILNSNLGIK